jgi:hypothetical protein
MKRLLVPALALAVMTVLALWWFSPTQVIKRKTHSLLETMTLDSGTGRATRQMGVYSLNSLLAAEVELHSPSIREAHGTFDRADIESAYSWLCQQARQTKFDLRRIHAINVSGDHGKVEFSVDALVELPSYSPADGSFRVTLDWRREDDNWRLFRASWIEGGP